MSQLLLALATVLLLNVVVGLYRVIRGPLRTDRVLAAQLFGTTGVATLLVLASAAGDASLRDAALIFALLSTVTTAAFVGHGPSSTGPEPR